MPITNTTISTVPFSTLLDEIDKIFGRSRSRIRLIGVNGFGEILLTIMYKDTETEDRIELCYGSADLRVKRIGDVPMVIVHKVWASSLGMPDERDVDRFNFAWQEARRKYVSDDQDLFVVIDREFKSQVQNDVVDVLKAYQADYNQKYTDTTAPIDIDSITNKNNLLACIHRLKWMYNQIEFLSVAN